MNRLARIPQLGSLAAAEILEKLESMSSRLVANSYAKHGDCILHYHRSPRYWIRAMDFEPYFKSSTRDRSIHHIRDIHLTEGATGSVIGAILNSSLFFFWFIAVGNGRNITGTDVEAFPSGVITDKLKANAVPLFAQLMKDYQRDSIIRERQDCEFQEFRPSLAKGTIDKIDAALARHYGFSDEELDFIVNYDIKYRLGADVDEE